MDIRLNDRKVREMAARLRQALGLKQLTHGLALEGLAQALGHRNWDTLSGLLKRESIDARTSVSLTGPLTLYVTAFSCDEWGDGPSWAKLRIDQEFLDNVLELRALCRERKLAQVRRDWEVDVWHADDSLAIRDEELVVGQNSWWISARPKHANYDVETRMLDVDWLLEAIRQDNGTEFVERRKDVLLYDPSGSTDAFVQELIDAGQLDEDFLER